MTLTRMIFLLYRPTELDARIDEKQLTQSELYEKDWQCMKQERQLLITGCLHCKSQHDV